jgi:FAD/FMN-containing dehydrogenase
MPYLLFKVNYARSRGIQFAARSGGHSLTTSLRRIKNAIVIDMRKLNGIRYDENKRQMTVAGGITTGEFANATFSQGMEVSK